MILQIIDGLHIIKLLTSWKCNIEVTLKGIFFFAFTVHLWWVAIMSMYDSAGCLLACLFHGLIRLTFWLPPSCFPPCPLSLSLLSSFHSQLLYPRCIIFCYLLWSSWCCFSIWWMMYVRVCICVYKFTREEMKWEKYAFCLKELSSSIVYCSSFLHTKRT